MFILGIAFEKIVEMLGDKELPVRVSAALAITPFLKYDFVCTALKPHAIGVMQHLLTITNEIDLDTLADSMEALVFEFAEELKPFATSLTFQLVN